MFEGGGVLERAKGAGATEGIRGVLDGSRGVLEALEGGEEVLEGGAPRQQER